MIEHGENDWRAASVRPASISTTSVKILSPVTTPCRVYCQGANYRQHMLESGMNPDEKLFNMFFTKSDASIGSAHDTVRQPAHVKLLYYEVELALVFRRSILSAVTITSETIKDYVFAIAIANDLSARDVQLPQMQFFKGKSYRGFCPIGPWLTVLEPEDFSYLDELDLRLSVNGIVRKKRFDEKSRFQTGRDHLRTDDLRQRDDGGRAIDRYAEWLRAANPSSTHSPTSAAVT